MLSKFLEMLAAFALGTLLVWVSFCLQDPFLMTGSAAVAVLTAFFTGAFFRAAFLRRGSIAAAMMGLGCSALWYPLAYWAVDAALNVEANQRTSSALAELFRALLADEVYLPVFAILAAISLGGIFGVLVKRWSLPLKKQSPA